MDHPEEIAKWDAVYEGYDIDPTPEIVRFSEEVTEVLLRRLEPGASLLEVGCGSGHLSGLLAKAGFRVTLLDFSEQALGAARRYFARLGVEGEFRCGDMFDLAAAVGDARYDLVWNSGVLEHYAAREAARAVGQMVRHSAGQVMAIVPNGDCLFYRLWRWKRMRDDTWSFGTEVAHHSLRPIFRAAGLGDIDEQTCGRLWALWMATELTEDAAFRSLLAEFYDHLVASPQLTDYLILAIGRVTADGSVVPPEAAPSTDLRSVSLETQATRLAEAVAAQSHLLSSRLVESQALQARIDELEAERARQSLLAETFHSQTVEALSAVNSILERSSSLLQAERAARAEALRTEVSREVLLVREEMAARLAAQAEETTREQEELRARLAAQAQDREALEGQLAAQAQEREELEGRLATRAREAEEWAGRQAAREQDLQGARAELEAARAAHAREAARARVEVEALRAERAAYARSAQQAEAALQAYQQSFAGRWQRRWRRFVAEFLHGGPTRKQRLLGDLWRLIRTGGRKQARRVGGEIPAAPPAAETASAAVSPEALPSLEEAEPEETGPAATTGPYDVLLFPIIEWEGRFQRPQQLGTQLARRGHRVFCMATTFVEAPEGRCTYREIAERVIVRELGDGIYWVQLVATRRLARYEGIPSIYRGHLEDEDDLRYLRWSLRAVRERYDVACTVSLVDLPFWAPLVSSLPHNRVVYDCMDEHGGFASTGDLVVAQETGLLRSADLVLFTAQRLRTEKGGLARRHVLVPNACDYDHFAATGQPAPADFPDASGPVIGYYGAIAHWFDSALVTQLAEAHREWTFVLIGSDFQGDTEALQRLPNVHLLGEKPYAELPAYLSRFDVAIIPFVIEPLTLATNPVKFYEYAAAGKPVVATRLPELEPYADGTLVQLATGAADLGDALARALQEDCEEARAARRRFAREQTWERRAEAVEEGIRRYAFPRVSVILLTYNKWEYTDRCLRSLIRHSYWPELELVVVDNVSTDQTRAELARLDLPNLRVLLSERNLGFAGGNNRGMEEATGDYFILLNNDTEVTDDWVAGLLTGFESDDTGMVAPVTNCCGNDQVLPYFVGKWDTPLEQVELATMLADWCRRRRRFDSLGFFCVMLPRRVYEDVGGLDDGYEVGMFEDDDYCERLRQAGYRLVVVDDVFVRHYGSVSFSSLPRGEHDAIWRKNLARFEGKWARPWTQAQLPLAVRLSRLSRPELGAWLQAREQPSVIVLGSVDWHSPRRRPQQLAYALARAGVFTFYITRNQSHDRVQGYEQVDENLFLIAEPDHLRESDVDLLYLCGEADPAFARVQPHRVLLRELSDRASREARPEVGREALLVSPWEAAPERGPDGVLALPDGVDYDHFHLAARPEPPPDLRRLLDLGRPVLGCHLPVEGWADPQLLQAIAEQLPEWSIALLGPGWAGVRGAREAGGERRLRWLGEKEYGRLPAYLAWFDVAAFPVTAGATAGFTPVGALLECLAAGKPVVSSPLPGSPVRDGLLVARTAGEFAQAVREAYARRADAGYLHLLDRIARENSWEARIRVLLERTALVTAMRSP